MDYTVSNQRISTGVAELDEMLGGNGLYRGSPVLLTGTGIDLDPYVRRNLLMFHTSRPSTFGLEMHLVRVHKLVEQFDPQLVILDPVSSLQSAGTVQDSNQMLVRLIDFLGKRNTTSFFVSLTAGGTSFEHTDEGMSSLVDPWLLVRDVEVGGERNRLVYVLKSRGMAHSNQVREFLITRKGVQLRDAYLALARSGRW